MQDELLLDSFLEYRIASRREQYYGLFPKNGFSLNEEELRFMLYSAYVMTTVPCLLNVILSKQSETVHEEIGLSYSKSEIMDMLSAVSEAIADMTADSLDRFQVDESTIDILDNYFYLYHQAMKDPKLKQQMVTEIGQNRKISRVVSRLHPAFQSSPEKINKMRKNRKN